jgi:UDP-N-acetylglucosamine 2-epimerase (non-hydrolysing)
VDALLLALERVRRDPPRIESIPGGGLAGLGDKPVVLVTAHRRESLDGGLASICGAVGLLAERFQEVQFVYPIHLNPNVERVVLDTLGRKRLPNVRLLGPLSYPEFVALMDRATIILTDSGGVQEEAPTLGKPVVVARRSTERMEAVEAGASKLVGADCAAIVEEVTKLLTDRTACERMARVRNPYGDGRAAQRIVDFCASYYSLPRFTARQAA